MADGRWAPSPTGDLHVGNLRTALLAWLFARSSDSRLWWRFEDLDASVRPESYERQLADVAALGLDWDGEPVRQSARLGLYRDAIADLEAAGLTYECWCTRREIRQAAAAPNSPLPEGAYPGTCRDLDAARRAERRATGRPPALRLRSDGRAVTVHDRRLGAHTGVVDDVVLRRGDGTPAYNLCVVVDDADMGVGEVVRGDDLLASTPRQVHLASLLGVSPPSYAHVPLVLDTSGRRLAKRDGAVTVEDLGTVGVGPEDVLAMLAASLGLAGRTPEAILDGFDPATLPRDPWVFEPPTLSETR